MVTELLSSHRTTSCRRKRTARLEIRMCGKERVFRHNLTVLGLTFKSAASSSSFITSISPSVAGAVVVCMFLFMPRKNCILFFMHVTTAVVPKNGA
jgi:hypothetical protein